jgi:DNA-binding MarR family transcriptional regulator
MIRRTRRDAADGRAVHVSLTPAGRHAAATVLTVVAQHADELARVFSSPRRMGALPIDRTGLASEED